MTIRRTLVEPNVRPSMRRQCELLGVNRSSLYYEPIVPDAEELSLMRTMDELHLKHPFFGSRMMTQTLKTKGLAVNRKRVQRLMRVMGLESIAPKPTRASRRRSMPYTPTYCEICGSRASTKFWASDITYSVPSSRWHQRDLSMSGIHLEKGGYAIPMTAPRCGGARAEAAVTCCTLAG